MNEMMDSGTALTQKHVNVLCLGHSVCPVIQSISRMSEKWMLLSDNGDCKEFNDSSSITIPVIILSKEYMFVQKCYSIVNDEIISIKHIKNTCKRCVYTDFN